MAITVPGGGRRNSRLENRSPRTTSGRGEGASGRNLQVFAQQLDKFGQQAGEFADEMFRDHGNKIEVKKAENALRRADVDAQIHATTNASADGSNLRQLYEEKYKELSGEIVNPLGGKTREAVSSFQDKIYTSSYGQLSNRVAALQVSKMHSDVQEQMNIASSRIRLSPGAADFETKNFIGFIDSLPGLYTPEKRQEAKRVSSEQFAFASLNGRIDKGDYEGAKRAIDTDFSTIFDADGAQSLVQKINDRQLSAINRDIQLDNESRRNDLKLRESVVEQNFDMGFRSILESNSPEQNQKVLSEMEELRDVGLLNDLEYRAVRNAQDEVEDTPQNRAYKADIRKRISSDESGISVRQRVKRGLADKSISKKEANSFLNLIDSKRNLVEADPGLKSEHKRAKVLIEKSIDFLGMNRPSDVESINKAEQLSYEYMEAGMSPFNAAKKSLEKLGLSKTPKGTLKELDQELISLRAQAQTASSQVEIETIKNRLSELLKMKAALENE